MKLNKAGQLIPSLKKDLKPVVWIAGDEPLLLQESADAVRSLRRETGFEEREVFTVDRSFDWNSFKESVDNLSLFATRKLIELRLSSPRLEEPGRGYLLDYLQSPNPDYLLLITSLRVEPATMNTRWFKTIEASAWFLPVWPLGIDELPDWLAQRLIKTGLRATPEAIQLLVQRIEGNLLAAVQEIEKLKLLVNPAGDSSHELDADQVLQAVADSSRYTAFNLIDAALVGDPVRTMKILQGLREEGTEALAILGAVCAELRRLLPRLHQVASGQAVARVADEAVGRNFKRKGTVSRALQRLRAAQIYRLLDQARAVDYAVKGLSPADPWLELESLFLSLSGSPAAISRLPGSA
ncbi:MAG: DNA polymerase III subunit delta [Gammaproteobacteria bacterium]|nr:DNA polymerase III subunit delta [Pseudomonadales bacterium]MCP5345649.1 DNA polymerase III subunit delta [Pseudomonadales bacterium]